MDVTLLAFWKDWALMNAATRWYWAVSCDNTVSDPFVGDEGDLGCDEWELRTCNWIVEWSDNAWVRASTPERDGEPDDVLQTMFGLPIFSARLRTAIHLEGIRGVQYLPIEVIGFDRRKVVGFSIVNLLNCVDALDRNSSTLELFPPDYFLPEQRGEVRSITKPVLVLNTLFGFDIVRLSNYRGGYICLGAVCSSLRSLRLYRLFFSRGLDCFPIKTRHCLGGR